MRNEYTKFLDASNITDGVLREFVIKELWSASVTACDDAISKRSKEIQALQELKETIKERIG